MSELNPPPALSEYLQQPHTVTAEWWEEMRKTARNLMAKRKSGHRVLLVITAQHPLLNGTEPGEEFKQRLKTGVEQAHLLTQQGKEVEVYVPGSRHVHNGVADRISLAEAGTSFLATQGLGGVVIHGEDLNERYKGSEGVYNGADEAFVTASYFKDNEALADVRVVCAPGQQNRWLLNATANGINPTFVSVDVENAFHEGRGDDNDPTIQYTRYHDPTWQDPKSFLGQLTRLQRRP